MQELGVERINYFFFQVYIKQILQQRLAYKRGTSGRRTKGIKKTQIVKPSYPQVSMDAFVPSAEELTEFENSNNHLKSIFRNGQAKDKKEAVALLMHRTFPIRRYKILNSFEDATRAIEMFPGLCSTDGVSLTEI